MTIDSRLGCSTISFRAWPLSGALAEIRAQGFVETDLGSLPRVCDHVPIPLPANRVDELAKQILDSGATVRLINADVADMDDPDLDTAEIQHRLQTLIDLAQAVGTSRSCFRAVDRALSRVPSSPATLPPWRAPSPRPPILSTPPE